MVICLLLSPLQGFADDSVGMTIVSRGDVELISAGESGPLGRGDFLVENDQIIVNDRSFAVVQFNDGSKLSLRPNSSLVIEHYRFAGAGDDRVTLNLLAGGLRLNQGAIASRQTGAFRVRTPNGLLFLSEKEGLLTLCEDEICEQQGLAESPDS